MANEGVTYLEVGTTLSYTHPRENKDNKILRFRKKTIFFILWLFINLLIFRNIMTTKIVNFKPINIAFKSC